jgi:hypothetical protein
MGHLRALQNPILGPKQDIIMNFMTFARGQIDLAGQFNVRILQPMVLVASK